MSSLFQEKYTFSKYSRNPVLNLLVLKFCEFSQQKFGAFLCVENIKLLVGKNIAKLDKIESYFISREKLMDTKFISEKVKCLILVLTLDGSSEIGAHVMSNVCYLSHKSNFFSEKMYCPSYERNMFLVTI